MSWAALNRPTLRGTKGQRTDRLRIKATRCDKKQPESVAVEYPVSSMITPLRPRPSPQLLIADDLFSQPIVRALVEDCIVPALVEEFLRTRLHLPDPAPAAHNETQL